MGVLKDSEKGKLFFCRLLNKSAKWGYEDEGEIYLLD